MKLLVILSVAVAFLGTAKCDFPIDSAPESSPNNFNQEYFKTLLKQRKTITNQAVEKFEEACPGKGEAFEEAMQSVQECVDKEDAQSETICSFFKNNFLRCSQSVLRVLEDCLPKESKALPNTIFQSIAAATDYICKINGEHIFELANGCLLKSDRRLMRCQNRIKSRLQQYKTKSPTKEAVCELVQSVKPCLHEHLVNSCRNVITRESFEGLFNALISPCSSIQTNEVEDINEVETLE